MEENIKIIQKYLERMKAENYERAILILQGGNTNPFFGYVQLVDGIDNETRCENYGDSLAEVIEKIAGDLKAHY